MAGSSSREALVRLYNATYGESWTDSSNWLNSSSSICTWYGVTCDASGTELVTKVELLDNGLAGTLPTQLGLLNASLHALEVPRNSMSGTLPVQLSALQSLGGVSLSLTIASAARFLQSLAIRALQSSSSI